jgi:hypothetical protein
MARQTTIPGTEAPIDPEIAKLGEAFAKAGSKAKKANEDKKVAMEALVAKMREKKIKVYRDMEADPPIRIKLSDPKFTVKVETIEPEEETEPTQAEAKA